MKPGGLDVRLDEVRVDDERFRRDRADGAGLRGRHVFRQRAPVLDPRAHSAVEQRHVVEARVDHREHRARRRLDGVLRHVDDDVRVVGDADRLELRAKRVGGRHLERQRRLPRWRGRDLLERHEARARNVAGIVRRLVADVQQHQVGVRRVLREPRRRDQQRLALCECGHRRAREPDDDGQSNECFQCAHHSLQVLL